MQIAVTRYFAFCVKAEKDSASWLKMTIISKANFFRLLSYLVIFPSYIQVNTSKGIADLKHECLYTSLRA